MFKVIKSIIYLLVAFSHFVTSRVLETSLDNLQHVTEELKLVHVIFRHGERTPTDTYPNDIYINQTFHPYGWGQLTNKGKENMYKLGQMLRDRYRNFLGDVYSPTTVHAQSTWSDRAHTSCALVLAGLWPPKGTALEWNSHLNWSPIPIKSETLEEDTLLLAQKDCPRYFEELENVYNRKEIQEILYRNKELFENLTRHTGSIIQTPRDVQSLYSTLDTELRYGLKLPEWTNDFYPNKLIELTMENYLINAYNVELKRLKGGPLLKKLLHDWNSLGNVSKPNNDKKLFVYSGHDSTVSNIFMALGVWERQIPGYGLTAIFELSQDRETKEYAVTVFLINSTSLTPHILIIPGCQKRCPLTILTQLTKNVVPEDWTEECKAKNPNYISPPLGEP